MGKDQERKFRLKEKAFIFKLGVELEFTQEVTEILLAQKVGQLEILKSHHVHVVTCAFAVSTFSVLEFNTEINVQMLHQHHSILNESTGKHDALQQ